MYSLTIAVGTTAWSLLFKTMESAQTARDLLAKKPSDPAGAFGYTPNDLVLVIDDFGQEAGIYPSRINGWLLEDMNASKLAHIERGLHSAKTQAQFEQTVRADPAMRAAAMAHGPGMIHPFPPNGRGPN